MKRATGVLFAAAVIVLGSGVSALAADATGTWKWTVERNGNTFETTLKLKQEGEKLTGTITGRQGNETEIEEGAVKGEKVTFKVTREFNGNKMVFSYEGKLSADEIKGETKWERDGEAQTREWNAKREK
ncbi:MAG: hypothetical protein U0835_22225 [Isosphaeraceae bacterium]